MVFWGLEMFNENVLKLNLSVRCYLKTSPHTGGQQHSIVHVSVATSTASEELGPNV